MTSKKFMVIPVKYRDYFTRVVENKIKNLKNDIALEPEDISNKIKAFQCLLEYLSETNDCDQECTDLFALQGINNATQIDLVANGEIVKSFEVK